MDESLAKLLIAVVTLLVTGLGSHLATKELDAGKIEQLSREASAAAEKAKRAETDLQVAKADLASLRDEKKLLTQRLAKFTRVDGRVVMQSSLGGEGRSEVLPTGDALGFPLTGSSVSVRVLRVTNSGVVVRIEGCDQPHLDSFVASPDDSPHAYLVSSTQALVFWASTSCCAKGIGLCDVSDLEEVAIGASSLDVANQTAELRSSKKLVGQQEAASQ